MRASAVESHPPVPHPRVGCDQSNSQRSLRLPHHSTSPATDDSEKRNAKKAGRQPCLQPPRTDNHADEKIHASSTTAPSTQAPKTQEAALLHITATNKASPSARLLDPSPNTHPNHVLPSRHSNGRASTAAPKTTRPKIPPKNPPDSAPQQTNLRSLQALNMLHVQGPPAKSFCASNVSGPVSASNSVGPTRTHIPPAACQKLPPVCALDTAEPAVFVQPQPFPPAAHLNAFHTGYMTGPTVPAPRPAPPPPKSALGSSLTREASTPFSVG